MQSWLLKFRDDAGAGLTAETPTSPTDTVPEQSVTGMSAMTPKEGSGSDTRIEPLRSSPTPAPVLTPPLGITSEPAGPSATRRLDSEEIALLVKRGEDFLIKRDIPAARLVLQRAAEAGDARAALFLGSSYDPILLEQLGVRGLTPDIALAQTWYERAKELSSAEATRRLEMLASRGQSK